MTTVISIILYFLAAVMTCAAGINLGEVKADKRKDHDVAVAAIVFFFILFALALGLQVFA